MCRAALCCTGYEHQWEDNSEQWVVGTKIWAASCEIWAASSTVWALSIFCSLLNISHLHIVLLWNKKIVKTYLKIFELKKLKENISDGILFLLVDIKMLSSAMKAKETIASIWQLNINYWKNYTTQIRLIKTASILYCTVRCSDFTTRSKYSPLKFCCSLLTAPSEHSLDEHI